MTALHVIAKDDLICLFSYNFAPNGLNGIFCALDIFSQFFICLKKSPKTLKISKSFY